MARAATVMTSARVRKSRLFEATAIAAGVLISALFVLAATSLMLRGLSGLGAEAAADRQHPLLPRVLGTLILVATAAAVCVPISGALALVVSEAPRGKRFRRLAGVLLQAANATPSIVFGLFGFVVFVDLLGFGKSWLTGGLLLGWMSIPTLTAFWIEAMRAVPDEARLAARGLGLSLERTALYVILPRSLGGAWRGLSLALARAAGETAPILFTAVVFSGPDLPTGVRNSPIVALPYHLFVLSQDTFDPVAERDAWTTALVLLALVFAFYAAGWVVRRSAHEEASFA